MRFGKTLGMITVYISSSCDNVPDIADLCFKNILEFAISIKGI